MASSRMRFSSRVYAVAALLALVACSHAAKVTTSGDTTTVANDQGAVTIGASADPAKVGAPIYRGQLARIPGAWW